MTAGAGATAVFTPARRRFASRTEARAATVLLLILLAATALRLYRLDDGLWLDEILTDVSFVRMPVAQIVTTFDSENQHFLYSLMAHAAYQVFGPSAWALRLPAVIFGVGSILALYLFARRVTTVAEALLSAALLAFSYHHVWFSQNARGYTGLLFWTLVSSALYLSVRRPAYWLAYGLAVALGMYAHLTMAFVLAGHALLFFWTLWQNRKHLNVKLTHPLLGFASAAVLTLILYSPVLSKMLGTVKTEATDAVAIWQNPLWTALEMWRGLGLGFLGQVAVVLVLVLFGVGTISYVRTRFEVALLLIAPAFVGAVAVIGLKHHLWPRFFFFVVGFAVLVLVRGIIVSARGAGRMFHLSEEIQAGIGIASCIVVVGVSAASVGRAYGPKQDFRGALTFVEEARGPRDAVVTIGLAVLPYQAYYSTNWIPVQTLAELNAIRQRAACTWLVYTLEPQLWATAPQVMNSVGAQFRTDAVFPGTLAGGDVIVASSTQDRSVSCDSGRGWER